MIPHTIEQLPTGYGSPLNCDHAIVAAENCAIAAAIKTVALPIERHNLMCTYLYRFLEFSSCMRPRNDPDLMSLDFDLTSGIIAIADKISPHYIEERFILLPGPLLLFFDRYFQNIQNLQDKLATKKNNSVLIQRKGRSFFFIDPENARFRPFTLGDMKQLLGPLGVDTSLPPNMPRHLLNNYLRQRGAPREYINYWMGHQHAGRELHGLTSSASFTEVVRILLPMVTEFIRIVGFNIN